MQHSLFRYVIRSMVMGLFSLGMSCWALEGGKSAPPLDAELFNHKHFNLEQEKGHVVIVTFWASWCPYCLEELPILNRYYLKHKKEGLRVLAISIDDPEDEAEAKHILRAYKIPGAFARNTEYKKYGQISRTPTHFIIDREGLLLKNGNNGNAFTLDKKTLEKMITPLLLSNHTPLRKQSL